MSPTDHPTDDGALAPPDPELADAVDAALVGLPAPPKTRVWVLVALLVALSQLSLFLAWQLRDDVRFAFASTEAVELGDARAIDPGVLRPGQLVRVHAAPQMAGAVRYHRLFWPGEFVVFPVAGRSGEAVYVQSASEQIEAGAFTARVVRFGGAGGRYARVGDFLREQVGASVNAQSSLLIAGASPRSFLWAPALAALLLAITVTDLLFLVRLLRPVPVTSPRALGITYG